MWHLAVHPDFQRRGVATDLFDEALSRARNAGVEHLEAWTRDDESTISWYENRGFVERESYLHVYLTRNDAERICDTAIEGLSITSAFARYVGDEEDQLRDEFDRVHEYQQFIRSR